MRPDIDLIDLDFQAAARRSQAATRRITTMSLLYIAARTHEALPHAAACGLRWSRAGHWLLPAGFFTANGTQIGCTSDGEPAGGPDMARLLAELAEDITVSCTNLGDGNEGIWRPWTTSDENAGDVPDENMRMPVAAVLAHLAPARTCGCPSDARARVGGVLITGHQPGCCRSRSPRVYVWPGHTGGLATGTLADFARAYEKASTHPDGAEATGLLLRTWDDDYQIRTEPIGEPTAGGRQLVRLSVPGEEVIAQAADL